MSTHTLTSCSTPATIHERVRYYPRQLIGADTLTVEQEYLINKARQHNRQLHGWGVVCGFEVEATPQQEVPLLVTVCPGYALSPQGDAIDVQTPVEFDLAIGAQTSTDPCTGRQPCPPIGPVVDGGEEVPVYLAVRYTECYSRPERVPSVGCGCDETACEYARIRDGFELKLLFGLPESHRRAAEADAAWCEVVRQWASSEQPGPAPVPPCPPCDGDPWVVIARIRFLDERRKTDAAVKDLGIGYQGRRVLQGVSALQTLTQCLS